MNKETQSNNNEVNSEASKWDILSEDLQNEIAETVEDVEIEEAAKAEEAEKAKQETSELIQEVIKLRGKDSVKQGEWDNDLKAHIDANGMPTDYAHLMRYVKENPDAIETLKQERDDLLAKVEASSEDEGAYARWQEESMVKNAENLFPDDELAQGIASTNSLLDGESKEDFANRIRRAAEAQRAAESGPSRMETGESQDAYNKRIGEMTDAAMQRENILSNFDRNRPLWPQLDKDQKKLFMETYPRRDDETSAEWQKRVEEELGAPVWINSKAESGNKDGSETPKGPENPKGPDGSNGQENQPNDADENKNANNATAENDKSRSDYFPRPVAFTSNEWYYMNRKERREAAEKARAEAAAAAETPEKNTGGESVSNLETAKNEAQENKEANVEKSSDEEPKTKAAETKKAKVELGEKAKEVKDDLINLHDLRWRIMSRVASIEAAQSELEDLGKPGLFDSKGRKRRKELLELVAKNQEELDEARKSYPAAEKAFAEKIKSAGINKEEIATLADIDRICTERGGRGTDRNTVTVKDAYSKQIGLVKKWEDTVEEAKRRKDREHIASNTEELQRQRRTLAFEGSLAKQLDSDEFKPVLEKIRSYEKAENPRETYMKAVSEITAYRDESNAKLESLPEDQKEAYKEERRGKMRELATKVGEASRGFCRELANRCSTKELADAWNREIAKADTQSMFYAYRKVAEIVPGIKAESINAAKRVYDNISNQAHRKFVEDKLKQYFGANDSFIAQLRGADGEQQQGAA